MSTQALVCPRHEDRQVELRLQSLHTDSGRPGQLIELWECPECGDRGISPWSTRLGHCPRCGHRVRELLETWISKGKRRRGAPSPHEIRERTLQQIARAPDPFGRSG